MNIIIIKKKGCIEFMAEVKVKAVKRNRNQVVFFYCTEEEKQQLVDAAFSCDQSLSDFCRKVLAEKCKEIGAKSRQS